jgi:hypothetical protein
VKTIGRALLTTGLVMAAVVTLSMGRAAAGWSAAGTGSMASASQMVPAGGTPSVLMFGRIAIVSWPTISLPGGTPVSSYVLQRTNILNGTTVQVCATTGTICFEGSVPDGAWQYRVRGRLGAWIGAFGPPAATVYLGVPAPLAALDVPVAAVIDPAPALAPTLVAVPEPSLVDPSLTADPAPTVDPVPTAAPDAPAVLDPAPVVDPAPAVEPAPAVDPAAAPPVEPVAADPTASPVDPAAVDPAAVDPAAVDPAVVPAPALVAAPVIDPAPTLASDAPTEAPVFAAAAMEPPTLDAITGCALSTDPTLALDGSIVGSSAGDTTTGPVVVDPSTTVTADALVTPPVLGCTAPG